MTSITLVEGYEVTDGEIYVLVVPPTGVFPEVVVKMVRDLIENKIWDDENIWSIFDDDWVWKWVTTKSETPTSYGKLSTRLNKLAVTKIDDLGKRAKFAGLVTQICNMVREHIAVEEESYYVRFTRKFDWIHGQYNDLNSCYWGGRSTARKTLAREGAIAMQILHEHPLGNEEDQEFDRLEPVGQYDGVDLYGRGRCWIVPRTPNEECVILFNGYGYKPVKFGQILSAALELPSIQPLSLTNGSTRCGEVYINHRNGDSAIVLSPDGMRVDRDFDLEWEETGQKCDGCEHEWIEHSAVNIPDQPDLWLCPECAAGMYQECCSCQQMHYSPDMQIYDGRWHCPACYSATIEAQARAFNAEVASICEMHLNLVAQWRAEASSAFGSLARIAQGGVSGVRERRNLDAQIGNS